MAGVVLIGGMAIFLAGLAVGIILANIAMRREDRRARLIGKARSLMAKSSPGKAGPRSRDLDARISQPDGGPWR
jgi:hypothetical protein